MLFGLILPGWNLKLSQSKRLWILNAWITAGSLRKVGIHVLRNSCNRASKAFIKPDDSYSPAVLPFSPKNTFFLTFLFSTWCPCTSSNYLALSSPCLYIALLPSFSIHTGLFHYSKKERSKPLWLAKMHLHGLEHQSLAN